MIVGEELLEKNKRASMESNYDYLFRNKKERKQHKQVRKQTRKKIVGQLRHPVATSFGLLNKVNTKVRAGLAAAKNAGKPAVEEQAQTPQEEEPVSQEVEVAATPPETEPVQEDSFTEEEKPQEKNTKSKEGSGSPLLGIFFLGLTFFIAAAAIYHADKRPVEDIEHLRKI